MLGWTVLSPSYGLRALVLARTRADAVRLAVDNGLCPRAAKPQARVLRAKKYDGMSECEGVVKDNAGIPHGFPPYYSRRGEKVLYG